MLIKVSSRLENASLTSLIGLLKLMTLEIILGPRKKWFLKIRIRKTGDGPL